MGPCLLILILSIGLIKVHGPKSFDENQFCMHADLNATHQLHPFRQGRGRAGEGRGVAGIMLIYIIFAVLMLFVFAYYFAFEYYRYKTAKRLSDKLGGRAVFRIGGSYMKRDQAGVVERAWVVPDDKMAWGSILSVLPPPLGILFLQRATAHDFRFYIEPKTGALFRSISLGSLKDADFNVPHLDENLRLRTNSQAEAASYFSEPKKQQALVALFLAGFTQLKGYHGAIVATMKGCSAENFSPEKIDRHLGHLRNF